MSNFKNKTPMFPLLIRETNIKQLINNKIKHLKKLIMTKHSENTKPSNSKKPVLGEVYWTYNIVYLPIKVKVLEIDEEGKKARIEQGWIEFDRLYNSEEGCPQR
jgi:hypothetical protein